MLISTLGALIVVVALLDLFLTVLDANGFSVISSRVYRALWWVWRHGARGLPPETRRTWLSMGAPLMIPGIVVTWFALIITGFALIYFGGMSPQNFLFGGGSQPSLESAFRLSWVTLSTIGFVEISPSSTSYSFTVAAEAIIGGVVLTMAITYYLRVHEVLLHFHCLATSLHHHAGDITQPNSYLATHFPSGQARAIESWLADILGQVVLLHEGMRRHPIVYYYHPRRQWRSLPHLMRTLGEITAGLRWGLPATDAIESDPSLHALGSALLTMVDDLERQFVPVVHRSTVVPATLAEFRQVVDERHASPDPWVNRFLALERAMCATAGGLARGPVEQQYGRFLLWLPFTIRIEDFVRCTAWDLGYGSDLEPDPDDVLDLLARLQDGPEQQPQPLYDRRSPR